jgi:hypothetical protein
MVTDAMTIGAAVPAVDAPVHDKQIRWIVYESKRSVNEF